MERPDARARLTGPCGDTDEMFLRVCSDRVQEVRFLTDGCFFTTAACDATALLARGKTIDECLTLDEQAILDYLEDMPEDHTHCAILALLTLREAIHQYLDHQRTGTRP
jgi:nitrogen fixation NifU-like protein